LNLTVIKLYAILFKVSKLSLISPFEDEDISPTVMGEGNTAEAPIARLDHGG
jgi:hypothetical protein